jgi:hypothetical protein
VSRKLGFATFTKTRNKEKKGYKEFIKRKSKSFRRRKKEQNLRNSTRTLEHFTKTKIRGEYGYSKLKAYFNTLGTKIVLQKRESMTMWLSSSFGVHNITN